MNVERFETSPEIQQVNDADSIPVTGPYFDQDMIDLQLFSNRWPTTAPSAHVKKPGSGV